MITYCTNDYRFIGRCIAEAKKFSSQIVIPVCNRFFDGSPENDALLGRTYSDHPDCQFIEFNYIPDRVYSRYHRISPTDPDWASHWAATTRYVGLQYLHPDIEWVLFLDSDEIVEGDSFLTWLNEKDALSYSAQRLAAYLYAIRPNLRSTKFVNLPLLIHKETIAPLSLLNPLERIGCYQSHLGPKRERVLGLSQRPFVHHYSWVRTREECLQKARTWSHRNDLDWENRIEKAFAGDPSQLFEFPVSFEEIANPYFNPFADFSNVRKIDDRDLVLKEIENLLC